MNIDHCNSHSSFKDKVEMSNLCQEITLPTYPIQHIDDTNGEIALCILSAINVGKVKSDDELEELCDLSVRGLDELIDYQKYLIELGLDLDTIGVIRARLAQRNQVHEHEESDRKRHRNHVQGEEPV